MKQLSKVSVCMITYNHEKFIEEAINGVLMQECDFEIELILVNDCSSDKTDEVIRNVLRTYPRASILKYINHEKNIGMILNFIFALQQCKGKYIALCEGDDYWTDPLKLQKQVDFLDTHPSYSACFNNAKIINEILGEERKYLEFEKNKSYSREEIIEKGGGLFPTASLLFKNINHEWPDFIFKHKSGDRALSLLLADKGNFHLLNEETCAYRRHDGGIYSSIKENISKRTEIMEDNIVLLDEFNLYTSQKYNKIIKTTISKIALKILSINNMSLKNNLTSSYFKKLLFKHKLSSIKMKIYVKG